MLDLQPRLDGEPEIVPGRKLTATVAGVYAAPADHFETQRGRGAGARLRRHRGRLPRRVLRASPAAASPGTSAAREMRNERQLSIVAPDELAIVAGRMGLAEIKPEWIGANLLLDGMPQLSMLPSGTLLFFKGGVTIKIDAQNGPCRDAGRAIAERAGMADRRGRLAAVSRRSPSGCAGWWPGSRSRA